MNILLIDDEATFGWKEVVEKVFFGGDLIEIADNKSDAIEKIKSKKYDLIFLDIRFSELDHKEIDIHKMTGYNILTKEIRSSLNALNFSTPVLIFTASNKVWNINKMIDAGADDYYIKEHPDTAADFEFSRSNFIRLKGTNKNQGVIGKLLELGKKRNLINEKINEIVDYLNSNINNENIKNRIQEKLKIGYGLLFRNLSKFENSHFIYSNESLAYVVFWSILEEISKDYFENNWILSGIGEGTMKDNKWKLRKSGSMFIEDFRYKNFEKLEGFIEVAIDWDEFKYVVRNQKIDSHHQNLKFYTGKVSLSLQVYAIMLLEKKWEPIQAKNLFKPLNDYRNEVDFIHSSVSKIFSDPVSDFNNNLIAFEKCNEMLVFISKLLKN
jgi:CheY-like chemotaxis protein